MAPRPDLITPLGQEMLETIPPFVREDPDIIAILHVQAKEAELRRERLEETRRQLLPHHADTMLGAWEALLRMTVVPLGLSLTERRDLALAFIRGIRNSATGRAWEASITRLAGPGWTYQTHDPADPDGPDPDEIIVRLPFPPSADLYRRTERLLQIITPATVTLTLTSAAGFLLDISELDQEPLL